MAVRISTNNKLKVSAIGSIVIVLAATAAGMFSLWRVPSLSLFAEDWLMRERGSLATPDDIVIVAIDEASINKLGQFPWKRQYTARLIDTLAASNPKAVGIDVLYSEPSTAADDQALVNSIKRAGNVAVGEQLYADRSITDANRSVWLRALPEIETAAAGTGHVNVETEADGAAREILLRMADDDGESRWALAVETVRIGDGLDKKEVTESERFVRIGARRLPFASAEKNLLLKPGDSKSAKTMTLPRRMKIDYIGPTGSFAAQTFSFSDVLEGRISPERFRGKYVLIGATASTLGDKIATPFVHAESVEGDQHGDLMPGVEILANSVNTILRGSFYQPVSDWTAAILAAAVALVLLLLTGFAQGSFRAAKQLAIVAGLGILIVAGCYAVFVFAFVVPPVVPLMASLIVATPLAFLQQSLSASRSLDDRLDEMLAALKRLQIGSGRFWSKASESQFAATDDVDARQSFLDFLPRGVNRKAQALERVSQDLISHSVLVDCVLRSLDEGLLVAAMDGRITFANAAAAKILGHQEEELVGMDLFKCINDVETQRDTVSMFSGKSVAELFSGQGTVEREITLEGAAQSIYILRLSAVAAPDEGVEETTGIVATLMDITKHRELQRTQNDVVTLVTHELRTPLTAIQGMSEILTEHDVDREARQRMLSTINTESKRLARMINDYLDIARVESGTQKARFSTLEIDSLLDHTLLILEPLAKRRKIKLSRAFMSDPPVILGDTEMIGRAITNIVANAIKYSPERTVITIKTQGEKDFLIISVRDNGYGISADHLPHIFEKFYRISHRDVPDISGTGLGLSMAREIIELHGGQISVESEPNIGSTFTISLPQNVSQ